MQYGYPPSEDSCTKVRKVASAKGQLNLAMEALADIVHVKDTASPWKN